MTQQKRDDITEANHDVSLVDMGVSLNEIFVALWKGKWIISMTLMVTTSLSFLIAVSLPNQYRATAVLSPVSHNAAGLSGLLNQYGGIASLAGLSLPSGNDASKTQLGLQLMKSRGFIWEFVNQRQLLPDLMAVSSWNKETGVIVYDPDIYDEDRKIWTRQVDPPLSAIPSPQEAHKAFTEIINVSQDPQTGYVSLSIEHQSAELAAQWVTWIVEDINASVKEQDVAEALRSIEYLKIQVANTSLAELQAVFFELIQSQTETVMLAEVRPEYVFKTIDPALVPQEKSGPMRSLIVALGILAGLFLSASIVLFRRLIQ